MHHSRLIKSNSLRRGGAQNKAHEGSCISENLGHMFSLSLGPYTHIFFYELSSVDQNGLFKRSLTALDHIYRAVVDSTMI